MRFFLRTYIWSPDTLASITVALILYFFLPDTVGCTFAKDIYGVGISVLSIIFSVFFAGLAVIITSSDDVFVRWLEEQRHYRGLICLFKITLMALFLALLVALTLYLCTSHYEDIFPNFKQNKAWLIFFSFLFVYSLVATALSVLDAIKYAERRTEFIELNNRNEQNEEE